MFQEENNVIFETCMHVILCEIKPIRRCQHISLKSETFDSDQFTIKCIRSMINLCNNLLFKFMNKCLIEIFTPFNNTCENWSSMNDSEI